jgi:hypothetical protein
VRRTGTSGPRWIVKSPFLSSSLSLKHLVPVIYGAGTPGDFAASGTSLVLPRPLRARAGSIAH